MVGWYVGTGVVRRMMGGKFGLKCGEDEDDERGGEDSVSGENGDPRRRKGGRAYR